MERAEYIGQACLHFVEAMPIAAGRAGRGALMLQANKPSRDSRSKIAAPQEDVS